MFDINNCSGTNEPKETNEEIDPEIDPEREYTYEEVISLTEDTNLEEYNTVERLLEEDNLEGALEFLRQWHYPGEHMTNTHKLHLRGEYYIKDSYILNINRGLGTLDFAYILKEGE